MIAAGLIEYVSIAQSVKIALMIWAYDGHRSAYWQASPRMSARQFFFDHSQSMSEVHLRRNRVSCLSYRQGSSPLRTNV